MSYIESFEQELIAKLNGNEDNASVVRWVSEKVLESYLVPTLVSTSSGQQVAPGDGFALFVFPYLIFLIIGIFFGWKNLKSKEPSLIGHIITIIGIVMLLLPFFRG